MASLAIPEIVRTRALLRGDEGQAWIGALPAMIESLARDWNLQMGPVLAGGTDALVAGCRTSRGEDAVLKIVMPGPASGNDQLRALLAFKGRGYVTVLRHDELRNAMLLERLGPQLSELGLPVSVQIEVICTTLRQTWTSAPDGYGFMTGAEKAESLAAFITDLWRELAGSCARRTIDIACDFTEARRLAFDPDACVLAHGDAHAANTLAVPGEAGRFKFIDPDGLFVEPAYDLAIPLREWGAELLAGDPALLGRRRCEQLARLTGVEAEPIWQWGFIERVSTGLLLHQLGRHEEAREFLTVADAWAEAA